MLVYCWEKRKGYNSRSESTVTVGKSHSNNDFGMTSIKTRADSLWVTQSTPMIPYQSYSTPQSQEIIFFN